jgi:hypothetical protein
VHRRADSCVDRNAMPKNMNSKANKAKHNARAAAHNYQKTLAACAKQKTRIRRARVATCTAQRRAGISTTGYTNTGCGRLVAVGKMKTDTHLRAATYSDEAVDVSFKRVIFQAKGPGSRRGSPVPEMAAKIVVKSMAVTLLGFRCFLSV